MRWTLGSSRSPIGIDVGSRQIKAAQLSPSSRGWCTEALSVIPRTRPGETIDSEEVRTMYSVLRRQGFRGNSAVVGLPDEKLLMGILELPPRASGAPIDQIARMELSRTHRIPPDSFEMSYWDLPASSSSRDSGQVMAVGCAHAEANALLDIFESEGLNVIALDASTCAAVRALRPMFAAAGGITAVLDLGWSSISLSILHRGIVTYERVTDEVGLRFLLDDICKQLQVEQETAEYLLSGIGFNQDGDAEELDRTSLEQFVKLVSRYFDVIIEDLQAPLSYVPRQYSDAGLARVLLIGGGAGAPGVTEYLSSALQAEVLAVTPGDLGQCSQGVLGRSTDPALTLAMGLAMFTEEGGDVPCESHTA